MYPSVLSESQTLDAVLAGRSLARYGDGEFTLAEGKSIVNQPRRAGLCARLRDILLDESGDYLVGIPNLHSPTPKAEFWAKYQRVTPLLSASVTYGSSFITRPDSAPWIDTPEYWAKLDQVWAGKAVTLVRGTTPATHPKKPGRLVGAVSLLSADLATAASVTEVVAPSVDAWAGYADLLDRIGRPATAVICLGATATVLAVDLCRRGVHAIDLGHVGMFLRQVRRQPAVVAC